MTTVIACAHMGLMVCDSNITDGDRLWLGPKVRRWKGSLIGLAGDVEEGAWFFDWFKRGQPDEKTQFANSSALILTPRRQLFYYERSCTPELIRSGREAIGSGAKAAMAAFEALNFTDPRRAVRIVCKHDAGSRGPVRSYLLKV